MQHSTTQNEPGCVLNNVDERTDFVARLTEPVTLRDLWPALGGAAALFIMAHVPIVMSLLGKQLLAASPVVVGISVLCVGLAASSAVLLQRR